MPPLIPFGFGNRAPDVFGNVHTRLDERGLVLLRAPGDYAGRHREVAPRHRWRQLLQTLARLAGGRV